MKLHISNLLTYFALLSTPVFAQSIDVKPAGVDIGATATGATGALIKQEGAEVSILHKDGVNPPELRVIVTDAGNVGIGTDTPTAKLEVDGDTLTTGSATVGSLIVGTSTIFTEGYFESSTSQLPGSGNTLTVAHGLGGTPRFATVSLRCITAEYGWAVGDEIMLNSIHMRSDNDGATIAVNATHFKFRQKGHFQIHRIDSTSGDPVTTSRWRLVFRAWR